jgi:hypothetical protein
VKFLSGMSALVATGAYRNIDPAQFQPPRPTIVGPNVQVNDPQEPFPDGLLGRSETTIAANETGRKIVAGWNDAQGFCGQPFGVPCTPQDPPGLSGYGYSTDFGLTWVDGGAPPLFDNVFTRGDPWLDRGGFDKSTYYYANLSVDYETGADLGVSVHRGHFFGNSFAWEDVHVFNAPNAPNDFYDKEALAAAKDGSGAAYVSVTNFQEVCGIPQFGFGQIEVWRTHDGGDTWQGPAIAGPEDPVSLATCGNAGAIQTASEPAIGPHGEVYVSWQFGPIFLEDGSVDPSGAVMIARSLDGGQTFEPPVKVAEFNSNFFNPPVGYNRSFILDHPRISVAPSGRVYVSFAGAVEPVLVPSTAQSTVSSQGYVSYSDNRGKTWSRPKAIAPAVPLEGVKRIWPTVSVSQAGRVDVTYYEFLDQQITPDPDDIECSVFAFPGGVREGPASSLSDTYRVRSPGAKPAFGPPTRITTETTNWCTVVSDIIPNFGDYIDAITVLERTLALWADGRNGIPDVFFAFVR